MKKVAIMNRMMRNIFRLILVACVTFAAMAAGPASAQTKVRLGAQTIGDYIAAYMGQEYGIYAKHGLDVTLQPITISTLAAASLMSGSLDLATSTVPDMIQAVDNGIDLVAISGIGVLAQKGGTRSGVVVQPDVNITKASDFIGKKVGISALGGLLHILFQNYLMENGVDPQKVTYVEIPIPSHFDAMKSHSVDAVVTADPMMARILATKVGKEVLAFGNAVPPNTITAAITSTREYAKKNPAVITNFRKAWQEATDMAINQPEKARAAMVKYLKLPAPVAATIQMPLTLSTSITLKQLQWWQDIMRKEHLIQGKTDLSKVILP